MSEAAGLLSGLCVRRHPGFAFEPCHVCQQLLAPLRWSGPCSFSLLFCTVQSWASLRTHPSQPGPVSRAHPARCGVPALWGWSPGPPLRRALLCTSPRWLLRLPCWRSLLWPLGTGHCRVDFKGSSYSLVFLLRVAVDGLCLHFVRRAPCLLFENYLFLQPLWRLKGYSFILRTKFVLESSR